MARSKKRRMHPLRRFSRILLFFVLIFVLAVLLRMFAVSQVRISGRYMETTMYDQDLVLVNRLSYKIGKPHRFDLVVFPFKYKDETQYVGRVIGLSGETVQIDGGKIYINGVKLEENYGNMEIDDAGLASNRIILREGEYFILSDNRSSSLDSREPTIGNVQREDMIGKVFLRIWPLSKIRLF